MPTLASSELPVPKSWEEFEDICADLFSRIWNDRNVVRYALLGERQNGVDIRGRLADGAAIGAQCKRKRQWPVSRLTTGDIDDEIAEALKFKPALTEFTIATTAPNSAALQAHVDSITERHREQGLFSVHLLGWSELSRRITDHPQLIEKHFGFVALSSVRARIDEIPNETARLVADLTQVALSASPPTTPPLNAEVLQPGLAEALERDFQRRYSLAMQRSMFPELQKIDLFQNLANAVPDGVTTAPSAGLRRLIFLRAARSRALRGAPEEAEDFLAAALALPGSGGELPARARIMDAQGDGERAISMLRDERDAESRSVLLDIIVKRKGDAAALDWLRDESIVATDLTPGGVMVLCQIHLRRQDFVAIKQTLGSLGDGQLRDCPYFLFFRGIVRFAAVLSRPEQGVALTGLPLDARFLQPILPTNQLEPELDAAHSDLERFLSISDSLELREASRLAEAFLVWCDLLHPRRKDAALAQLRSDMADPAKALSRVQFALAYDADHYDREPLARYLDKRESLGGLNSDELRAALVLHLHGNDPSAVAALIAKHRAQCSEVFPTILIVAIEIEALILAGEVASARLLLETNRTLLGQEAVARLNAEIARAEGADPVVEYKRVYEADRSADSLRFLLRALTEKSEHRAIGPYAEELFSLTGNPRDIAAAAQAYASAGDNDSFMRIVEAHPKIKASDRRIEKHYAWQLFQSGRIKEAAATAVDLARSVEERDLDLEVALALETGDWEMLANPLAAFLDHATDFDATSLIRAAYLAQASGQGRLGHLVDAAVAKGGNDPNVLVSAYSIVLEEGLEDRHQQAHEWFRRALDLSGADGPVKRFELKELLSRQAEWLEHTRAISDAVAGGEMPLLVAAPGLRSTLVDVLLGNLIRNSTSVDSRKRSALTTYSGRRGAPIAIGAVQRIAIDISAVMVLGWLGLLPRVFEAFPEIVLPAGILQEMFEGRGRIRSFQKSRLRRAEHIRDLIAEKRFKIVRTPVNPQDPLAREIGLELANLIRAAQANAGVVVRAAPVTRLGLEDRHDADVSAYASVLTDTHTLLDALRRAGSLDQIVEDTARQYFSVQDRGWPAPTVPRPNQALYLDSLSLIYLDMVGLLDPLTASFSEVHIDASAEEEAFALIEHQRHAAEILRVIDDIRNETRKAHVEGKIIFGARTPQVDETIQISNMSTLYLLNDLHAAEAAVFDDRALNKEPFLSDRTGQRARIVTSLDIIEELHVRGLLTDSERRNCRHRLRLGGACLVPLDTNEVKSGAVRNGQYLSPEFRAIRDSIDLPRMAEIAVFPVEIPWLMTINSAIKSALVGIWKDEVDSKRASEIADTIHRIYPSPEDWVASWKGQAPPKWVLAVTRILHATLALPFELGGDLAALERYNEWLEKGVLAPMRKAAPENYRAIVEYVRNFVLSSRQQDNDGT
jgi:hypothetical protein